MKRGDFLLLNQRSQVRILSGANSYPLIPPYLWIFLMHTICLRKWKKGRKGQLERITLATVSIPFRATFSPEWT